MRPVAERRHRGVGWIGFGICRIKAERIGGRSSVIFEVTFDMQKLFTRILIVTVAVIVAASGALSSRAVADAVWINGSPVFRSDIVRQERLMESRREKRRRQYRTVYPVYMTGGPRPDIAPSAPPIASLSKSEKETNSKGIPDL